MSAHDDDPDDDGNGANRRIYTEALISVADRLDRLEALVEKLIEAQMTLADAQAEQNLRARFIMGTMRITRKDARPALLDAMGKAPTPIVVDGWRAYLQGGRDATLMMLERELQQMRADNDDTQKRRTPADGSGSAPTPTGDVRQGAAAPASQSARADASKTKH